MNLEHCIINYYIFNLYFLKIILNKLSINKKLFFDLISMPEELFSLKICSYLNVLEWLNMRCTCRKINNYNKYNKTLWNYVDITGVSQVQALQFIQKFHKLKKDHTYIICKGKNGTLENLVWIPNNIKHLLIDCSIIVVPVKSN